MLEKEEIRHKKLLSNYEEYSTKLEAAGKKVIDKFIDDDKYRRTIVKTISTFHKYLSSGFISFFSRCIEETWSRSAPSGAFEGYNQNLILLLDILTTFELGTIPPALLQTAVYALEQVAYFVGNTPGKSYAAKATWDKRKSELSDEMVDEVRRIADHHQYTGILILLDE